MGLCCGSNNEESRGAMNVLQQGNVNQKINIGPKDE